MKTKPASKSAFLNPRVLLSFAFCAIVVLLALGVAWSASSIAPPTQSASSPQIAVPVTSSGLVAAPENGPAQSNQIAAPNVLLAILYDQTDNPGTNSTSSQDFETANDAFDDQAADDFVVPSGDTWTIQQVAVSGVYFNGTGPAASFNVTFYTNTPGNLPGAAVPGGTFTGLAYTNVSGTFTMNIPNLMLTAGTYWVSVQARMDFTPGGQWGWTDRTVTSNSGAAWQNPGGGFAAGCLTWGRRGATCLIDAAAPDQIFQILGTGVLPSPTPTATVAPTPTPTPTPTGCAFWSFGATFPAAAMVRAVGNYFPTNGRFYTMGGRSADTAGSDFTTPFEYNPTTDTWMAKVATYPDNQVNNMACGVLTVGGTPQIYCVGGSAAGGTTAASRVFSYNPVTDVITTLAAGDNWPGNTGTILPGGFAVVANKLYIIGGFNIGTGSTAQTWQFDPTGGVGSKWLQRLNYPLARSYVPAATVGGLIYTGGGSNIVTTTVTDTADSFKYDPVANTWTAIANIPRVTGETRAVTVNNQMWVLGGGRTAPNPSSEVDIYRPDSNTWSVGIPFGAARRNFPADSDGSARIWLAGGYTATVPLNTTEVFSKTMCPSIAGTVTYCSNPVPGPVPNVTLTLTGSPSGSALSASDGTYMFSSLASGGNYTVTPTKAARVPGTGNINTVDVIGVQKQFLTGTFLTGCKLMAADVNNDTVVNTQDVIAVQRFFSGFTNAIANVGKYKFIPVNRTYAGIVGNLTGQNYDTLVFGDVASPFSELPDGASQTEANDGTSAGEVPPTVATLSLPNVAVDAFVANFIVQVTTTAIDAKNKLVGFQGDFTFDERVVTFQSEPVQKAGLTGGNWNVSGNVLPGSGPTRTLRISAYSLDFAPLSGTGTLFELRMTRVSNAAQGTSLIWAAVPDQFIFIDADLKTQKPGKAAPGSVTPSGKRK